MGLPKRSMGEREKSGDGTLMRHLAITATRHLPERRKDALRPVRGHWQLVTLSGRIIGAYGRCDFAQAIRDAAMLRGSCGTPCDVRKAVR
jgi:hypothetical protein